MPQVSTVCPLGSVWVLSSRVALKRPCQSICDGYPSCTRVGHQSGVCSPSGFADVDDGPDWSRSRWLACVRAIPPRCSVENVPRAQKRGWGDNMSGKIRLRWVVASVSVSLCVLVLTSLSGPIQRPSTSSLARASRELRAAAEYHYVHAYLNAPRHSYGRQNALEKLKSACHQVLGKILSALAGALGDPPENESLAETLSNVARWSSGLSFEDAATGPPED